MNLGLFVLGVLANIDTWCCYGSHLSISSLVPGTGSRTTVIWDRKRVSLGACGLEEDKQDKLAGKGGAYCCTADENGLLPKC